VGTKDLDILQILIWKSLNRTYIENFAGLITGTFWRFQYQYTNP